MVIKKSYCPLHKILFYFFFISSIACPYHNFVIFCSINTKLGVHVSFNECRVKELLLCIGFLLLLFYYYSCITFACKGHYSYWFSQSSTNFDMTNIFLYLNTGFCMWSFLNCLLHVHTISIEIFAYSLIFCPDHNFVIFSSIHTILGVHVYQMRYPTVGILV